MPSALVYRNNLIIDTKKNVNDPIFIISCPKKEKDKTELLWFVSEKFDYLDDPL